jgi:hypothetical protein
MSFQEGSTLRRWGLMSPQGRRVFLGVCDRLSIEGVYSVFVLEQATLDFSPNPG